MVFKRLGLETARMPHADRHGLLYLSRGHLNVRNGTLQFERAEPADKTSDMNVGTYDIPVQALSMIILGPGSTISHDALRIMAKQGTGLVASGDNSIRCYTAPPLMSGISEIARKQVSAWSNLDLRKEIARRMYKIRMHEDLPDQSLDALRGIEGVRAKQSYKNIAKRYGIEWKRRSFDRTNPESNDNVNNCINHASAAVVSAASIAVYSIGAIPQLGFIHESSGNAFVLDIADLYRDTVTLPAAFESARTLIDNPDYELEKTVRIKTGTILRRSTIISCMIDDVKDLLADIEILK